MTITIESGTSIEERTKKAINFLGTSWIMHKEYNRKKNPAHMCKESYYMANLNKFHKVWRERK